MVVRRVGGVARYDVNHAEEVLMPWPKNHKARTRADIVRAAAAAFRARGLAGVRLDERMAASTLISRPRKTSWQPRWSSRASRRSTRSRERSRRFPPHNAFRR